MSAGFQPPPAIPPMPRTSYAPWGRRVLASVIDFAPTLVGSIVYLVGYIVLTVQTLSDPDRLGSTPSFLSFVNPAMIVGWVIMFAALPWNIYNRWIRAGRTGQSLGKRVAKLTLLSEQTGAPLGAGMAFLRDLVHTLDGMAYVGYLWPLWDEKRQTFADKLMRTVVLPAPDPAPQLSQQPSYHPGQ
jgi:uncharacterized RDD family membrane protein YckC